MFIIFFGIDAPNVSGCPIEQKCAHPVAEDERMVNRQQPMEKCAAIFSATRLS